MKKPNALEMLAYSLHSMNQGGIREGLKLDTLARLEAYVLGIDWRNHGVSLPVVKAALMGMTSEETAKLLGLELATVEEMLHRANQQLLGRFSVALAYYSACEYTQALQTLGELGYSDSRLLPLEVFQHFKPRRGEFRLEDCETELRFLASLSILRIERDTEPNREKVEHLLAILQSDDPRDKAARAQICTAIDGLLSGQYVSPVFQDSGPCIRFEDDEPNHPA